MRSSEAKKRWESSTSEAAAGHFSRNFFQYFLTYQAIGGRKKSTSIDFESNGILTLPLLISGQSYKHSINNVNYDSRVVILDCRLATDSCKRHGLALPKLTCPLIKSLLFYFGVGLFFTFVSIFSEL